MKKHLWLYTLFLIVSFISAQVYGMEEYSSPTRNWFISNIIGKLGISQFDQLEDDITDKQAYEIVKNTPDFLIEKIEVSISGLTIGSIKTPTSIILTGIKAPTIGYGDQLYESTIFKVKEMDFLNLKSPPCAVSSEAREGENNSYYLSLKVQQGTFGVRSNEHSIKCYTNPNRFETDPDNMPNLNTIEKKYVSCVLGGIILRSLYTISQHSASCLLKRHAPLNESKVPFSIPKDHKAYNPYTTNVIINKYISSKNFAKYLSKLIKSKKQNISLLSRDIKKSYTLFAKEVDKKFISGDNQQLIFNDNEKRFLFYKTGLEPLAEYVNKQPTITLIDECAAKKTPFYKWFGITTLSALCGMGVWLNPIRNNVSQIGKVGATCLAGAATLYCLKNTFVSAKPLLEKYEKKRKERHIKKFKKNVEEFKKTFDESKLGIHEK